MLKKKKTLQTDEPVIYTGPTIKNVIKQYTVFKSVLPASVEEKSNELPAIKQLIVPVSKLRETTDKIRTEGTPQNVFYKQLEGGR